MFTRLLASLLLFTFTFTFTAFAQEVKEIQGVKYTEEVLVFQTPFEDKGLLSTETKMVEMRAYLWRPVDGKTTPRPLVIYNHGSQDSGFTIPVFKPELNLVYLSRGYAVVVPVRKGFNRKDAPFSEVKADIVEPVNCNFGSGNDGIKSAMTDIKSTLKALQQKDPNIDFTKVIVSGSSRGGLLSVALAANDFPGVIAVINFAGGWYGKGCGNGFNLVKFEEFIKTIKVPVLSFYGDQDAYYSKSDIQSNLDVLKKIPGSVNYIFSNENHFIRSKIQLWWPFVEKELDKIEGKTQ